MNETNASKKVLLAEDDISVLNGWVQGLRAAGFDMAGRDANAIIDQATTGLAVLSYGAHELHISRRLRHVTKAVRAHRYDVCFMDGTLWAPDLMAENVATYDVVEELLNASHMPKVYLISSATALQEQILTDYGFDIEALRAAGRVESAVKDYETHQAFLGGFFGFETRDSSVQQRKGPLPSAPKVS